jgi:hypothetical protein
MTVTGLVDRGINNHRLHRAKNLTAKTNGKLFDFRRLSSDRLQICFVEKVYFEPKFIDFR